MKMVYWRPSTVPRKILIVMAMLSLFALLTVELLKVNNKQPFYKEKIEAALSMKHAIDILKEYRIKHIGPLDPKLDPALSGLIGLSESQITSNVGHLSAKQTSVNLNWAAVMVEMMKKSGVRKGDTIAAGFSGSFPALNLATLVAAKTLGCPVISITSVSASNWGANIPDFTWLDMERVLFENNVISHRSVAASLGGSGDRAWNLDMEGREMLHAAIRRNNVTLIEANSLKENIDARMSIYRGHEKDSRLALYVNTGGGIVSVGSSKEKRLFNPGLNLKAPPRVLSIESIMARLAREGIPVIHMIYIDTIADKYGIPKSPQIMPSVGEGPIFAKKQYNFYLVSINLFILLILLYAFLRLDIGYRIFGGSRMEKSPKHPQPMV